MSRLCQVPQSAGTGRTRGRTSPHHSTRMTVMGPSTGVSHLLLPTPTLSRDKELQERRFRFLDALSLCPLTPNHLFIFFVSSKMQCRQFKPLPHYGQTGITSPWATRRHHAPRHASSHSTLATRSSARPASGEPAATAHPY